MANPFMTDNRAPCPPALGNPVGSAGTAGTKPLVLADSAQNGGGACGPGVASERPVRTGGGGPSRTGSFPPISGQPPILPPPPGGSPTNGGGPTRSGGTTGGGTTWGGTTGGGGGGTTGSGGMTGSGGTTGGGGRTSGGGTTGGGGGTGGGGTTGGGGGGTGGGGTTGGGGRTGGGGFPTPVRPIGGPIGVQPVRPVRKPITIGRPITGWPIPVQPIGPGPTPPVCGPGGCPTGGGGTGAGGTCPTGGATGGTPTPTLGTCGPTGPTGPILNGIGPQAPGCGGLGAITGGPIVRYPRRMQTAGGIGVAGGSLTIATASSPPIVANRLGGASVALSRASAMPGVARARALPPLTFAAGGCNSLGGQCVINPANPSMAMQISPPAGDLFYVVPVLSYSNQNINIVNEIGTGWMHTFKRQVQISGTNLAVLSGSGQLYAYQTSRFSNFATPSGSSTVNSVQFTGGFSSITETQPDGTVFQYGAPSSGVSSLQYIQNPAGARWTVTYDGSGRVSFVTDPVGRATTLSYDATSGKIKSIQDSFGRLTSLTVNASGDLAQIISPELCIVSMVYDTSHRMKAWINPIGDRTSFSYGTSQLVLTSPLGAVTTLASGPLAGGAFRPRTPGSSFTQVTNPLGNVATLGFDSNGNLVGATDALGNITTYNWDANSHLLSIGDGLGNVTNFAYVTNLTNKIAYLSSITQPLGGIFTYAYNGNNQVSSLTDQLGATTTLLWNSSGLEERGD